MLKRSIAGGAVTAAAVAALAGAALAAPRPTPYACGSAKVTAWFFPSGHRGGFSGSSDSRTPVAYVYNGSSNHPGFGDLDAEVALNPLAGVEIGFKCTPKRPLRSSLNSLANTRTTKPSKVVCSFPRVPLIWVDVLPNGAKRLNLVLPPRSLVVTAEMKAAGKTLRYARRYCARTAPPSRFVPR